jgi:hypothetical protein
MTTTTLRPNGSGSSLATGITLTGGATLEAVLSDNSDASYVVMTETAYVVLDLTTVAMPAGAVPSSVVIRDRSTDGGYTPVGADLISNGAVIASSRHYDSGSISTYSSAPTAVALSQSDVDSLQLRAVYGFGNITFYELYLDITYALVPSVSVTAPTGSITTTTSPTIVWGYTPGTDGGPQSRYQLRVFSAAQYGIGGFDPGSSPATYDSAELLGNASSKIVGPLPNSTTYRAYVRVAQSINGAPQYSTWQYTGFSVAVTTADVSTVASTADSTNARIRVTVTRNTGTPQWATMDLQRSDDGGITWSQVRGATGTVPPGDVWIGYDYEAGNGVAAIYRARANSSPGGGLVTGAWVTSSSVSWSDTNLWLKDLTYTTRNMVVNNDLMPEPTYGRPQGVFRIIGSAAPVVVSDVLQYGVSTIQLETYTDAESAALKQLVGGAVLLLQAPAVMGWGSRYVAPGALREIRKSQELAIAWRLWQLVLTEVTQPPDAGLIVTGLTWQDIVNTYATWTAFIAGVPTWGTLV